MGAAKPPNKDNKLGSAASVESRRARCHVEAALLGPVPLRPRPESAELPGVADLREEFESFRRARREAWQQGRRAHEQQEREWLQSYLSGAGPRQSPPPNNPAPMAAVTYPGLRPAGKVADWNAFRAVVIPLGTLIYLKHSFQVCHP